MWFDTMGTRYSFTTVHRVFLWGRESIVFCFLVTRPWKKYIVYCCLFSHFTLKRYCIAIIFWYFHFFTQNDFIIHLYCCMSLYFIQFNCCNINITYSMNILQNFIYSILLICGIWKHGTDEHIYKRVIESLIAIV